MTKAGETALEAVASGAESARRVVESFRFRSPLQQNLNQALEKQPLLLGAIGLVIGAGIALAFPSTSVEKDLMGEAGAAAKDKLQALATDATEFATERGKQVIADVKNEAQAHGLTPSAATESLKGVAEKVKGAATSTREAAKQRIS